MMYYTIGVDFGSASVRAIVVDTATGKEIACGVYEYQFGKEGNWLDGDEPSMVRQHPEDYIKGLEASVTVALKKAQLTADFCIDAVVGIGIDTTGTTILPVLADGTPLAFLPKFKDNPNAYIWLWKDHTAIREAKEITEKALAERPAYMHMVGGSYSAESYWAKVLHCSRVDKPVYDSAYDWMEVADWIPFLLTGKTHVAEAVHNMCTATHKALYNPEWGGYPDKEFLLSLDSSLQKVYSRLERAKVLASDQPAGKLSKKWAVRLGLSEHVVVATSALDAHFGGIGAGIRPGSLVKILGTSSCDLAITKKQDMPIRIGGSVGFAHDSIIPGYLGIEAGQSAVGDIFNWFVSGIQPQNMSHAQLEKEASLLRPGQSGLLALDWLNGNRTILGDQLLSGLVLGLTLQTTAVELYQALIEAAGFGARIIHSHLENNGIPVEEIIMCGGIPSKNAHLMQTYADICKKPLRLAGSHYTSASGGAIAAAVCAGIHPSIEEAIKAMTSPSNRIYYPREKESEIYDRLYSMYKNLHDAFGKEGQTIDVFPVMKGLLQLKEEVRRQTHRYITALTYHPDSTSPSQTPMQS